MACAHASTKRGNAPRVPECAQASSKGKKAPRAPAGERASISGKKAPRAPERERASSSKGKRAPRLPEGSPASSKGKPWLPEGSPTLYASTLAQFIQDRVRLNHAANAADARSGVLAFRSTLKGMGNNLADLAGCLLLAAATGRRVRVDQRANNSVAWIWRDFFEVPTPDWFVNETAHDTLCRLAAVPVSVTALDALSPAAANETQTIRVRLGHDYLQQPEWDGLMRGLGGDAAPVEAFPWELRPADGETLVAIVSYALGALDWVPTKRYAADLEARRRRLAWLGRGASSSAPRVALQVRACVDCKHRVMGDDMVRQDVACDLEWLFDEWKRRGIPPRT
ncbi:hypothetical protein M885DRAFT_48654 [Pelagophyceae sp. CCMP2097]|nr:hypothetical protein M885DRAFT_48654 [Pelagophyceae sp. CCMP2097]